MSAWGVEDVVDIRKEFCESIKNGQFKIAQACRYFEISRPTGYTWLARYDKEGEAGLENRSSAPLTQKNLVSREIENQVLMMKYEFPYLGAKKILIKLKEGEPTTLWPSKTTIENILKRNGLVKSRRYRTLIAAKDSHLAKSNNSNDIWSMDFKGKRETLDGLTIEPFTLSDHYSRFLLKCIHLTRNDTPHVWAILDLAFREYGKPLKIRSDNGPPFATKAPGRFSQLSIKLIKAGVVPEWIEPGKPQQNGRHERMHSTMQQEAINSNLTLLEQIERLEEFQYYYNFDRPHEAIEQKTPGSLYVPSDRIWTGKFQEMEYANEYMLGKVRSCGKMWFKGKGIYISRIFEGEILGIKEEEKGLAVYFGPIFLGVIKDDELEVKRRQTRKKRRDQD